ncbi:MAG TPA: hypothetical protein VGV37_06120 [Aliidongia sp.]|uniref:hypothetical protein n=1 Tax=Aliidongia sp. TaxID=1914230 RepID=UPI002DDD1B5F|nr:hypothetical protein [Aliidongia sp.]HEV2674100.1 hypothetical protein [Aliidongia sp.]
MTKDSLQVALTEARRFILAAERLIESPHEYEWIVGTKLSGSVRRSSMDLTRALADLRRAS